MPEVTEDEIGETMETARLHPEMRGALASKVTFGDVARRWLRDPLLGSDPDVLAAMSREDGDIDVWVQVALSLSTGPAAMDVVRNIWKFSETGPRLHFLRSIDLRDVLSHHGSAMAPFMSADDIRIAQRCAKRHGAACIMETCIIVNAAQPRPVSLRKMQNVFRKAVVEDPSYTAQSCARKGAAFTAQMPAKPWLELFSAPGADAGWKWIASITLPSLPWVQEEGDVAPIPDERLKAVALGLIPNLAPTTLCFALTQHLEPVTRLLGSEGVALIAERLMDGWEAAGIANTHKLSQVAATATTAQFLNAMVRNPGLMAALGKNALPMSALATEYIARTNLRVLLRLLKDRGKMRASGINLAPLYVSEATLLTLTHHRSAEIRMASCLHAEEMEIAPACARRPDAHAPL